MVYQFLCILALLCILKLELVTCQPRIITRPLIHGQPAVLLCTNLPSAVTGVWTRNGSSTTLCPPPSTCINSPDSDNGYQFARNATGISVSISNITRIEEQPWTCGTLGGGPTDTYTIEYANVFVIPTSITVVGLEQNKTLADDEDFILTVNTACMNPEPEVEISYMKDDIKTSLPTSMSNESNTICQSPEANYIREFVISGETLCSVTLRPIVSVRPMGLPPEYSSSEWTATNYLQFPKCTEPKGLTADVAFGYCVLFILIGLIIGGILAVIVYKLLVHSGKLSYAILEATEELSVKLKLGIIATVIACLVCIVIAAIAAVADCGQTECSNLDIGLTAVFMVPGTVFQLLALAASAYIFVRCCTRHKNGVKKMEEDRTSDNTSHHHRRSVTITPSAIEVETQGSYSKNPAFFQNDFNHDHKKTRTESIQSETSISLKTDRGFSEKSRGNSKRINHLSESEASIDITSDRSFIANKPGKQDAKHELRAKDSKTQQVPDSGYNSTNQDGNKVSHSSLHKTSQSEAPRASTPTPQEAESDCSSESSDESIKDGGLSPDIYRKDHIWSAGRQRDGTLSPELMTNGHVNEFSSNDKSKVKITQEDNLSCIISVPTGDGHDDLESSGSSTDDDVVLDIGGKISKKKGSKKKRVKKKGWKKKKQAIAPEQPNNTEIKQKKKKKVTKGKKSKIIV